jgi:hypothetical protein
MTGIRLLDSSIQPILEIFPKETNQRVKTSVNHKQQQQQQQQQQQYKDESHNEHENEPQEDEDEELDLEYLKDLEDVEEWNPPEEVFLKPEPQLQSVTQMENVRILDDMEMEVEEWNPDELIDAIEERMRQTQLDLEKLKKLRNLKTSRT